MAWSHVVAFDSRLLDEREPPALQKKNVPWLMGAGFVLIALGGVGLLHLAVLQPATVVSFGVVMVLAGLVQGVDAVLAHHRGVSLLDAAEAVLYVVGGIALATAAPERALPVVGAVFGAFLVVDGITRVLAAGWFLPKRWLWSYAHGAVSFLTGFLLLFAWPLSGFPALALYLGVDLISAGITLIAVWSAVQDLDVNAPAVGIRGSEGGT